MSSPCGGTQRIQQGALALFGLPTKRNLVEGGLQTRAQLSESVVVVVNGETRSQEATGIEGAKGGGGSLRDFFSKVQNQLLNRVTRLSQGQANATGNLSGRQSKVTITRLAIEVGEFISVCF